MTIPEFELTIPPGRGQLTTVEGIIRDTVRDLSADQPLRRIQDEETWKKIEGLLGPLKELVGYNDDDESEEDAAKRGKEDVDEHSPLSKSFTLKVDDPSGNSFIEFHGSMADPKWSMRTYARTREQNDAIGLFEADADGGAGLAKIEEEREAEEEEGEKREGEEIYVFPGVCSSCGQPIDTRMKKVVIPYFKVRQSFLDYNPLKASYLFGCPAGCLNHVNKLRQMWLPGQRS